MWENGGGSDNRGDGLPNAAESLALAGKFADLLLEPGCSGHQRLKYTDNNSMLLTMKPTKFMVVHPIFIQVFKSGPIDT